MSNCAADRSSVNHATCTDDTRQAHTACRMHVRSVSIYTAYALIHIECLRPPKAFHVLQTPEGLAET